MYVAATFQVYLAFWLVCLVSHRGIGLLGALGLLGPTRAPPKGLLGPPGETPGERRCGSGAALPSPGQPGEQPPPPLHPPSSSPSLPSSLHTFPQLLLLTTTYYNHLLALPLLGGKSLLIRCYAMLCYAMLSYALLCYAMLCFSYV